MSKSNDDKLVDEYLTGSTGYSSRYKQIAADDVPMELDRAVLREAAGKVSGRRSEMWLRVAPALAIAATAVLTVSIVIRSGKEPARTYSEPVQSVEQVAANRQEKSATNADQATSGASAPVVPALQEAEAKLKAPAKEDSAKKQAARKVEVTRENEVDKLARVPLRSPSPSPSDAPAIRPSEKSAQIVAEQKAIAFARERRKESAPSPETQPGELKLADSVSDPRNTAVTTSGAFVATPPAAAPPAPVELTRPQAIAAARAKDASINSVNLEEVVVTGSVIRGGSSRDEYRYEPRPVKVPQSESIDRTKPSAWLKYIRTLRKANRNEEADVEWKFFVADFPNYSVSKRDAARPQEK